MHPLINFVFLEIIITTTIFLFCNVSIKVEKAIISFGIFLSSLTKKVVICGEKSWPRQIFKVFKISRNSVDVKTFFCVIFKSRFSSLKLIIKSPSVKVEKSISQNPSLVLGYKGVLPVQTFLIS